MQSEQNITVANQAVEKIKAEDTQERNDMLILRDGQIILPEKNVIQAENREFLDVVRETLPQEVVPEIVEAMKEKRPSYSRFTRFLFFIAITGSLVACYYFWPPSGTLVNSDNGAVIETQTPKRVTAEYSDIAKNMSKEMEAGHYAAAADHLEPRLDELLASKETFTANSRLLALYLSCGLKGGLFNDKDAIKLINKALGFMPDYLEWYMYKVHYLWRKYNEIYKDYNALAASDLYFSSRKLLEICSLVNFIKHKSVNKPENDRLTPEELRGLDLVKCRALIALWMVEGGPKNFPDDYGDPGVDRREEALAIARKYDNDEAFLKERLFIADKIKSGHWGLALRRYRFNGRDYSSDKVLDEEINAVNSIMENLRRK